MTTEIELKSRGRVGPLLLVVDDHAGLREAVAHQLREAGFEVVAVERADQAHAPLRVVRCVAVLSGKTDMTRLLQIIDLALNVSSLKANGAGSDTPDSDKVNTQAG